MTTDEMIKSRVQALNAEHRALGEEIGRLGWRQQDIEREWKELVKLCPHSEMKPMGLFASECQICGYVDL